MKAGVIKDQLVKGLGETLSLTRKRENCPLKPAEESEAEHDA